jgi:hypothetical protein
VHRPRRTLGSELRQRHSPEAIVAIACQKEREEGLHAVQQLSGSDEPTPVIVIIPLARDGCVDTEVDEERALELIALGCSLEPVKGGSRQLYG